MLKKIKTIAALVILSFIISSCSLTMPVNATGNPVGDKVGSATAKGYFGMFFNADASIRTAAKNGGITMISTVDLKVSSAVFGIITTYETIVTGK